MNILPVDIGRPIDGYSSAEAAIAAAQGHRQQQRARADGALLAGQSFVGGRCSYSRWCLEFSGSLWLDITCRNDEVDWRLGHEAPTFEDSSDPFALRWPSGAESVIDPAKLFANRVGAEFWQLWVNEVGFYVYLRRKLILRFHAVRRVDDGTCIHSVSEDD